MAITPDAAGSILMINGTERVRETPRRASATRDAKARGDEIFAGSAGRTTATERKGWYAIKVFDIKARRSRKSQRYAKATKRKTNVRPGADLTYFRFDSGGTPPRAATKRARTARY